MTNLRAALGDYLQVRRHLGFGLVREEKLLAQFIDYLDQQSAMTITVADALAWAKLPEGGSPAWLGWRLSVVRGFAAWLHTLDPSTQVPPKGLLPGQSHRAVPFLYSDADITALFTQAQRLRTPLRRSTIETMIGLMVVTGMRGGEVVALDDTYWYLHAAPELLAEAAERLEPEPPGSGETP